MAGSVWKSLAEDFSFIQQDRFTEVGGQESELRALKSPRGGGRERRLPRLRRPWERIRAVERYLKADASDQRGTPRATGSLTHNYNYRIERIESRKSLGRFNSPPVAQLTPLYSVQGNSAMLWT